MRFVDEDILNMSNGFCQKVSTIQAPTLKEAKSNMVANEVMPENTLINRQWVMPDNT